MAAPSRYTTKVRAKRIALQYFKRLHPFRRWKLILSIGAPAVGAAWLLVSAVVGDQRLYNGGPVSTAHAMFERECRLCHGPGVPEGTAVTQASLGAAAKATRAGFFVPVSNGACTACHAGPEHNAKSDTPACGSCHVEHVGRAVLVQVADRHCVQCHGDLKTKDGKPADFHASVPSLAKHPQFAVTVRDEQKAERVRLDGKPEPRDTTPIKLDHKTHLKVGLKNIDKLKDQRGVVKVKTEVKKPDGATEAREVQQLTCTVCHQPDDRGQYMKEIAYTKHCADCHELGFEGLPVPHDKPAIVRAFIRGTLSEMYDRCQALPASGADSELRTKCVELGAVKPPAGEGARGLRRGAAAAEPEPPADTPRGLRRGAAAAEPEPAPDTPRGLRRGAAAAEPEPAPDTPRGLRRGGGAAAEAPPTDAPRGARRGAATEAPPAPKGWVGEKLATFETTLLMPRQGCGECHQMKGEPPTTEVVPPKIPARWLPHARFDHAAHRPLACTTCHDKAATSSLTTDVLLPPIETCRECHTPKAGARTGCVECHRYHDKTQERDPNGPFMIQQLHRK